MNVLGSVFLGDAARNRVFSPSPTSPPASPSQSTTFRKPASQPIDPELSLELRIRWLEVLLLGIKQDATTQNTKTKEEEKPGGRQEGGGGGGGDALVLKAEQVQKRLDGIVESNDGLRKFMDRCE